MRINHHTPTLNFQLNSKRQTDFANWEAALINHMKLNNFESVIPKLFPYYNNNAPILIPERDLFWKVDDIILQNYIFESVCYELKQKLQNSSSEECYDWIKEYCSDDVSENVDEFYEVGGTVGTIFSPFYWIIFIFIGGIVVSSVTFSA